MSAKKQASKNNRTTQASPEASAKQASRKKSTKPTVKGKSAKLPQGEKPFAHPYYWAAFVLVGDPS